jgi:hypothetical protein
MTNDLQRIIALEAENKRLRDELNYYADPANWTINGNYPAPKWFRKPTGLEDAGIFAREALDQPAPTTGLLELAAACYKQMQGWYEYHFNELKKNNPSMTFESYIATHNDVTRKVLQAYEALPPETRQMLEDWQ